MRPRGYWADVGNRRRFLDELKEVTGVRKASDWQYVTTADAEAVPGGSRFLRYYNCSLVNAVCELYGPQLTEEELELLQNSRSRRRKGHWDDEENVRAWVRDTAASNGIASVAEWSRLSLRQVSAMGGAGLLKRMRLRDALALCYTDDELASFVQDSTVAKAVAKRSSQAHLSRIVASIFGRAPGAPTAAPVK